MADAPKMVTLLPSTDCDLGRWLMQHWQLPYHEKPHAPVFHILALRWNGVGKDDYPLLVSKTEKIPTIDQFLAELDPKAPTNLRLVPDKDSETALHSEVMPFQHDARFKIGGDVVTWAYFNFLKHKDVVWPSLTTGVPWYETAFLTVGFGVIKTLMYKGLHLTPESADTALGAIRKGFDDIDAKLADGRTYLFGDRLTIADLAFAASCAPMVLAKGYGGHLPAFEACPAPMQAVFKEFRARPTGQYIQRMYDQHRRAE